MKTSWKKRMISALLALTMVFSYLPTAAFALGDWEGNDASIHISDFKVNAEDGTWSVTFAGSGTTSGALAIVPNFHTAASAVAMGSRRGEVGSDANTANAMRYCVDGKQPAGTGYLEGDVLLLLSRQ